MKRKIASLECLVSGYRTSPRSRESCAQLVLASLTFAHSVQNESQISRNNLTFHSYSRLRVFGREFLMTMKMVIAPLTLVSLAVLFVYMEPHIPCVVMVLAKFAGHMSL